MRWKKGMLIYNINAGNGKLERNLEACLPVIAPHIDEFLILQTKEKGDASRFCSEYGEDMDVVFVLGGDGTVHECVNGLSPLEKRPLFGILPGGTCNDFSRTLNIPQNVRQAAEAIVNGKVRSIDIGQANNDYFSNFWGVGLISEASSNIDEQEKNRFGKIGYLLSAVRTIGDSAPFPYKLEYDGHLIEGKAIMILVLNGCFIGTNLLPFPMVSPDDGLFGVAILENANLGALLEIIAMKRSWTENLSSEAGVTYVQASTLTIESKRPLDVDMDGENYSQTPTRIKVLDHHLSVLIPN
ncbi:YegS/Rv2252/BmrU family lipid kinase [Peribacillus sp. NJ11]|uniref:YegS/Rv2252/BmrU family lipid kinase n=1 Tax=Peribacillus TaxID=2675229 RepID=UPI0025A034F5|nr:YegS/Rv2252/BmrU family lipid kinase [Peribacillus sp. NJ11]MDM5219985.1 YegS/Rv2252/BmrU family lipid kinase [Peribacillus sp. NJ11]